MKNFNLQKERDFLASLTITASQDVKELIKITKSHLDILQEYYEKNQKKEAFGILVPIKNLINDLLRNVKESMKKI